jgi:hypothetical protein
MSINIILKDRSSNLELLSFFAFNLPFAATLSVYEMAMQH